MRPPDAELLRTLAAIPLGSRVLDLQCGDGRHTLALLQLGFDVQACAPDEATATAARAHIAPALAAGASAPVIVAQPHALGYPDRYFDWVVAWALTEAEAPLAEQLLEIRRVLKPGAWVTVTLPAQPDADTALQHLRRSADAANLAPAGTPTPFQDGDQTSVRAIYRRVEADTPV